jgi:hypothetical protein
VDPCEVPATPEALAALVVPVSRLSQAAQEPWDRAHVLLTAAEMALEQLEGREEDCRAQEARLSEREAAHDARVLRDHYHRRRAWTRIQANARAVAWVAVVLVGAFFGAWLVR